MKKSALFLVIFTSTALLMAVNARAVNAVARLTLSPVNGTYNNGDTFDVTVGVDSGSDVAGAADGLVTYDSAKLDLVNVVQSSDMVFNIGQVGGCSSPSKSAGKFSFTCYGDSSVGDKVVKGNLMVATFKAKATGTATVNFTCTTGSGSDSNISSTTAGDIISCASNDKGSYTINEGGGGGNTATNTPTPTTEVETTTTSSELPKTGGIASTIGLISFGLVSILGAVFLKFL